MKKNEFSMSNDYGSTIDLIDSKFIFKGKFWIASGRVLKAK